MKGASRRGGRKKAQPFRYSVHIWVGDLGSWIVFGGRRGCMYGMYIHCTYYYTYIQSCAWHTMSSKRSPPTVNESTPEAAAAPTVDLHGVLVIESKRKKSTEWCGFAYGIIDDRNDLNFDGCRAASIGALVIGGALPRVSGLWSPPLFEDLQSKWANLEQNEKFLLLMTPPVLKSYQGPWALWAAATNGGAPIFIDA